MAVNFDNNGNPMPYRAIEISLEDFKKFFAEIDDRKIRSKLFSKLETYIDRFQKEVNPGSLWIMLFDGSYTTEKTCPNDIDFVSVVDSQTAEEKLKELEALTTHGQLRKGYDIRKRWHLDAYFVPFYPPDDERFILSVSAIVYWIRWFGLDRKERPKAVFVIKFKNVDGVTVGKIIFQALQDERLLQFTKLSVRQRKGNSNFTLDEIQNYFDW